MGEKPVKGKRGTWEKLKARLGKVPNPVWGFALGVVLVVVLFSLYSLLLDGSGSGGASFPKGAPAEFLYLDAGRADSYLAQVEHGSYEGLKEISKIADSFNGKLPFPTGGEAGLTRAQELITERVLQPTDASRFFDLSGDLEHGDLDVIGLRDFEDELHKRVSEGGFVEFETNALVAPVYTNAFLAVRQATTLEALFPFSQARREAARAFYEEVGPTARAVFAIRPRFAHGIHEGQPKPAVYLMPIRIRSLTAERSLLKYGGGKFTVIGKVVRDFPETPSEDHKPAYVDSPTLETWEVPLLRAPGELLCRTEQRCIREVRCEVKGVPGCTPGNRLTGRARREALERARTRILLALRRQTTIDRRGAVILPIAIYK